MSELLEEWVKFHAGGQYRKYEYHISEYRQAIELADELLKSSAISLQLQDALSPKEHIVLEIHTGDLPKVAFLFQVEIQEESRQTRLTWLPRRQTDKPILLAYRAGARAAIRHGLSLPDTSDDGPSAEWVAEVLYRHAKRTRLNPFESLDLHWTAVGSEPDEAFQKLHPRFVSGPDFEAADPVTQAKALAVAKKIETARDALNTIEKRARERRLWGDLHQLGSATIVLSQKLAAHRRAGDHAAEAKVQAAVEELELTAKKDADEKAAPAAGKEPTK